MRWRNGGKKSTNTPNAISTWIWSPARLKPSRKSGRNSRNSRTFICSLVLLNFHCCGFPFRSTSNAVLVFCLLFSEATNIFQATDIGLYHLDKDLQLAQLLSHTRFAMPGPGQPTRYHAWERERNEK